jgi:hypothetical protein
VTVGLSMREVRTSGAAEVAAWRRLWRPAGWQLRTRAPDVPVAVVCAVAATVGLRVHEVASLGAAEVAGWVAAVAAG